MMLRTSLARGAASVTLTFLCCPTGAVAVAVAAKAPQQPSNTVTVAPSSSGRGQVVEITLKPPSTSEGLETKDLLIPIGTVIGAFAGVGGAILSARVAAAAQERTTRRNRDDALAEEARGARRTRVQELADVAAQSMSAIIQLQTNPGSTASASLRLLIAQALGLGRLISDEALSSDLGAFLAQAQQIALSQDDAGVRSHAGAAAKTYETLLASLAKRLEPEG
jgi:hypothetical protein